ncbi:MAG: SpoIVB peptidase [Eubacterium sp.]|jgi:stage IV sporulation protein B|nr:SpoIVB peptidase [Eubacterium sp.]
MRRIYKKCLIASILMALLVIIVSGILYVNNHLPNTIFVNSNQVTKYDFSIPVSLEVSNKKNINLSGKNNIYSGEKGDYEGQYKLFGIIALKDAKVKVIDKTYVYPMGLPIGLYLKTQGVMIIEPGSIQNKKGEEVSPAEGKVFAGEYIVKFNDIRISNKAQLLYLISQNKSKEVSLTIKSEVGIRTTVIKPVKAKNGEYMLGIWVRDDSQGIGSMSFIYEDRYYALGHGISDIDTGKLLSSHEGTIYNANIWGVKKGKKGVPGGLCGSIEYNNDNIIGSIESNNNCGINGKIDKPVYKRYKINKMEMALKNEIKKGAAQIQFIVNDKVNRYDIEIMEINKNNKEKNMVIKIVDKDLLSKTNGIVQGMSGCPIIQNNKVIGAVTHVMVNDPARGYGIFAENMILGY